MLNPHSPYQDGSNHAANEYCPTCHGSQNAYWQQQSVASSSYQQLQQLQHSCSAASSSHREALIAYLNEKVKICDWHGVSDAANDLRVLEAQNQD